MATPPDVISIDEEPFGLSDTHWFFIRSSSDNLGLYESYRLESFLVAIDRKTGEETSWVLDRMTQRSAYSEDGEFQGYEVKRDADLEHANAHSLLAQYGGVLWSALSYREGVLTPPEITDTGDTYQAAYGDDRVFQITKARLDEALKKRAAFMAKNVSDTPRMASITTRQLYADRSIPLETCRPDRVLEFWSFNHNPEQKLLRVLCSDVDGVGETTAIITLKRIQTASVVPSPD